MGCKNVQEKPENKSLMQLADAADIRTQQQRAATSHFIEQLEITFSSSSVIITLKFVTLVIHVIRVQP